MYSEASVSAVSTRSTMQVNVETQMGNFGFVAPLVDQMLQEKTHVGFFVNIAQIYFIIQFLFSSLWPLSDVYNSTKEGVLNVLNTILSIVYFSPSPTSSLTTALTIAVTGVMIVLIFWFFFLFHSFTKNHQFYKFSIIATKFAYEFLVPVLIFPAALSLGNAIFMLHSTSNSLYWAHIVFSFLSFIFLLVLFLFLYNVSCKSLFISTTVFGSFDSRVVTFVAVSSVIYPVYSLLYNFPVWIRIAIQVIHLAIFVYVLVDNFRISFHNFASSVLFAALALTVVVDDLYFIAAEFFSVTAVIPFIVMLCVFVCSAIAFVFIFRKKIDRVVEFMEQLSASEGNNFDEYDFSESAAIVYLRVGFQKMCQVIIDFSFIHYIVKIFPDKSILAASAQIISFFPSEVRQMNSILSKLYNNANLSFIEMCISYQYMRVKTLRQSSVSAAATERIQELRTISQNCRNDINSFWTRTDTSIAFMENMGKRMNGEKGQWQMNIMNYPNNSKMAEEFSVYLAECPVELDASLAQLNRAQVIEDGNVTAVDPAFKAFVAAYPNYLIKKIVGVNGNIIARKRTNRKKGSTSSSSSVGSKLLSDSTVIDLDQEEMLAKQVLTYPKLRLALNRSLHDRSSTTIRYIPFAALISLVLIIVTFVVIFFYTKSALQEPKTSLEKLVYSTRTRFNIDIATASLVLSFAKNTGRMTDENIKAFLGPTDESDGYIQLDKDLSKTAGTYTTVAEASLRQFLDKMSEKASDGSDLYNLTSVLLNNEVNFSFCFSGDPFQITGNLKDVYVHSFYSINQLANNHDFADWYTNNDDYCELLNIILPVSDGTDTLYDNLVEDQSKATNDLYKLIMYFYAFIPFIFLVVALPITILVLVFVSDVKKIQRLLLKVDSEVKQRATEPISKNGKFNEESSERREYSSQLPLFVCLIILIGAGVAVLTYFAVKRVIDATQRIDNFNTWMIHASNRMTFSAEASLFALQAIILNDPSMETFITRETATTKSTEDVEKFYEANSELLQSIDGVSSYGYDSVLDDINLKQPCTLDPTSSTSSMREVYTCSSLAQVITILKNIITEILAVPDKFNGEFADDNTLGMIKIISDVIWPRSWQAIDRIEVLNNNEFDNTIRTLLIFIFVSTALGIIGLIISLFLQSLMKISYNVNFVVLQHLKPLDIINEQALLGYLLNKTMSKNTTNMGISQSIVHTSADGIISTSLAGIIESVNPAVSAMLGYTPDQMLGQQIYQFFVEADMESIQQQVAMMKNGQASFLFQKNASLFTDTKEPIICLLSIIGMTNESGTLTSFVFMFKNETDVEEAKKEAEKAKQQSEQLLYQILPKDIVLRLNQGEKDISFAVPSATICFIDIVRFSEFASTLTPSQILGTLSSLFTEFDAVLAHYLSLIKIKLIGDVYMAAGGLFMGEDNNPNVHAEEMVLFTFEALNVLEEINNKMSSNLSVRIGVNTGGPIIAGVLGTDKPTFDIIGDPINVASRLQSTSLPGKVQISQTTKDLISGSSGFEIELRNEVYLKGKGKTQTYFVAPFYQTSTYASGILPPLNQN